MKELRTDSIDFSYSADSKVLQDISFSVNKGELVAIIGPNGAGKSTLLKILTGFLHPDKGNVFIDNDIIRTLSPRERARRITMMTADAPGAYHLSVREYILLGDYIYGNKTSINVAEILRTVGLEDKADKRLGELSQGERQLAMVSRVMIQKSDIVLLDEAVSHMDIAHAYTIIKMFDEYRRRESGKAVIFVSHDINLASTFADRIFCMKTGKIIQTGNKEEIINKTILSELYGLPISVVESDEPRPIVIM